ncbi:hypothetical protein EDC04DRAFT_2698155 [Pisolithus marmoratus]|nr:hypothetical protein EDC04DRAFT_2698155 [Pisolithus marmoratus]
MVSPSTVTYTPYHPPSLLSPLRDHIPTIPTNTASLRGPIGQDILYFLLMPTSPVHGTLSLKHHRLKREHETPFVPVDPFSRRLHRPSGYNGPDIEHGLPHPVACEESLFLCSTNPKDYIRKHAQHASHFLTDTLPSQVYLHLMLRLASLYFWRVVRVFQDADVSQPDIDSLLRACETSNHIRDRRARMCPIPQTINAPQRDHGLPLSEDLTTENICPALVKFQNSWESFTKSLLREWKTLNFASALLLSAILSMFQDSQVAYDPVTRTTALVSLTCALMSLSYGCLYMVRFETMKSMYMAARWAQETQRTTTPILWNMWVLLALPAVWLAWSMIFFIVSILAFVWRSGSMADPSTPPLVNSEAAIGPRVLVSVLLFLGIIYFVAIVKTLQGFGRVNDATGWTETARETGNVIRERRDVEREMERGDNRGRARKRRRGKVNARENSWKHTRKDDGHESEPEPLPWTYGYNHDNRGSSSLDVITGPCCCGLDGVTSASASHERDAPHDLVCEGNRESGEENDYHCDDAASM